MVTKMRPCRKCDAHVAADAPLCPQCGIKTPGGVVFWVEEPHERRSTLKVLALFWLPVLLLCLLVLRLAADRRARDGRATADRQLQMKIIMEEMVRR